ncbi:MAG: hypothetical protein A2888_02940 [Chlamydiae bacterium RIFCSPLOWO2_01_FULL_28_7]|nr:MAG: hypothetical protein A2888_02940 [Chlamydiae bacterium RIFCSPLOWO2_01_FULL_28_7]
MKNKYFLVYGLGKSGLAAIDLLLNDSKEIIAVDKNLDENIKNKYKNVLFFNENENIDLSNVQTIILSPGISSDNNLIKKAKEKNIEILSEIELVLRKIKTKCIAITGTNGKSTLTSLITHILNYNNIKAVACGNIGYPLSKAFLEQKDTIFVIELSSFQLEILKSKRFDAAIIINITPDHLDRYKTFKEYEEAKLNILNGLKKNKSLYLPKQLLKKINNNINLKIIRNNLLEIAKKVCSDLNIKKNNIDEAIKTFKSLEHRIEFVKEINNIKFYNDSKATNIDSLIYAVKQFENKIILIAGGIDKNLSFKKCSKYFQNKVKSIIAIGNTKHKIKDELKEFNVMLEESLKDAILKAFSLAKSSDVILLSPGCSSFDMFKNFEDRGQQFKKLVNSLQEDGCLKEIQL